NTENEVEPLISIRHLSINPSPIRIPGFLKIDAHFNVTSTLPENLTVRIHMHRRINQHLENNHVQRHRHWRKIPCHRKIGSW
uniref:Uncharacterized protein n=1 Tax=Romanomermis culicivorax TaxID=13658 RepID=A0A915INV9_ROMCU